MLPSRPTLIGWDPASLTTASASVSMAGQSVENATRDLETDCEQMPDLKGWAGHAHDAALEMFGRTRRYSAGLADYCTDIAHALGDGSSRVGNARSALLDKATEIDQGDLHVTDQWVVLIKPGPMTAEQAAALKRKAQNAQITVNQLLLSVGLADAATASAMLKAAKTHGYATESLMGVGVIPTPCDEVPNPSNPAGILQQQSILREDMGVTIRDHQVGEPDEQGTRTIITTMQDGSKHVETDFGFLADRSKIDKVQIQHFGTDGNLISTTTSWKDHEGTMNTQVSWPNKTFMNFKQYKDGGVTSWATTADGRSAEISPYEFFKHPVGSSIGGVLTGVDKYAESGGKIPIVSPGATEKIGVGARFAGPAVGIGFTVYDMVKAKNATDACVTGISGGFGVAGAWGGGAAAGLAGLESGPADALFVAAGATAGEQIFGWIGHQVGEAVCG